MKIYDKNNNVLDIELVYSYFPDYSKIHSWNGYVSTLTDNPIFQFKVNHFPDLDHGIFKAIHLQQFIDETFVNGCRDSSNIFSSYLQSQFEADNRDILYQNYIVKNEKFEMELCDARIFFMPDEVYSFAIDNFILYK